MATTFAATVLVAATLVALVAIEVRYRRARRYAELRRIVQARAHRQPESTAVHFTAARSTTSSAA